MADEVNGAPLLELCGVTKSYRGPAGGVAVSVLQGVDLRVRRGDRLAIVGPSGSGKSTLLNIAGTLDVPDSGEMRLDGEPVAQWTPARRAFWRNRHIGFVFQLHHLLPQCTVLENVVLPALPVRERAGRHEAAVRGRALLERLGLAHRMDHRPAELSLGERQRAAVARALLNRPALILADEPTGSLDPHTARELFGLLEETAAEGGAALVVVTHAMPLAQRMRRVLTLQDGRLVETAP